MPLSKGLLAILGRGNYPLFSLDEKSLSDELVTALEKDAKKTVSDVKNAMNSAGRNWKDVHWDEIELKKGSIKMGRTDVEIFLGNIHKRLSEKYDLAKRSPNQEWIQRVRKVMSKHSHKNYLKNSKIILGFDPNLKMGNGLKTTYLTCLPDPAIHCDFGSQPNQDIIGNLAPLWKILKRRVYEPKPPLKTKKGGGKTHYVLAHLLNHNLNGPGDNPRNVTPFYAAANTDMANKVEEDLKNMVLSGLTVRYSIDLGPPVGMTPGRQKALDNCKTADQRAVINAEQYLTQYLTLSTAYIISLNQIIPVHPPITIYNYVPDTVPTLW